MKVLDYSWGRPGGAAIKASGFDGVMRYVPYAGDGGKGLGLAEIADLRENGLDIGLVFESTAGRMFDGYPAGSADAAQCRFAAQAIGFPGNLPIYFACDVDTEPSMLALVDDYLAGAAAVLGLELVGVYGEYDVIEHCHAAGTATWFWQTYAWSGGQRSEWNHIYQYLNGRALNGAAVDYNDAAANFGQWKAKEDDMGMTPDELKRMERLEALVAGNGYGANPVLTGEEALTAAAADGGSLFLGLGQTQTKVTEHIANHAAGVTGQVTEHTHTGGKVQR